MAAATSSAAGSAVPAIGTDAPPSVASPLLPTCEVAVATPGTRGETGGATPVAVTATAVVSAANSSAVTNGTDAGDTGGIPADGGGGGEATGRGGSAADVDSGPVLGGVVAGSSPSSAGAGVDAATPPLLSPPPPSAVMTPTPPPVLASGLPQVPPGGGWEDTVVPYDKTRYSEDEASAARLLLGVIRRFSTQAWRGGVAVGSAGGAVGGGGGGAVGGGGGGGVGGTRSTGVAVGGLSRGKAKTDRTLTPSGKDPKARGADAPQSVDSRGRGRRPSPSPLKRKREGGGGGGGGVGGGGGSGGSGGATPAGTTAAGAVAGGAHSAGPLVSSSSLAAAVSTTSGGTVGGGSAKKKAKKSSGGSHAGGGGESRRCVQPDTEVACKVRDLEGSGGWIWILGTVLRYAADTKKYEVLDAGEVEDDDNDAEKRRNGHPPQPKSYSVPRNQLSVLLPNPNMRLSAGTRVLAMYPDTTTFYPATVAENAASRRDHMYLLNFDDEEDDADAGGAGGVTLAKTVAAKYVAAGVL
ncbi:hypothetical protein BU14_0976s0002 [Porphyra umbilicalis]|uniref:SGF29 C-terminal domain-containing protein n=1 Tax=Porphyra umbilicalis TaxID=2786 RepID=A0A1X6NN27_PORUM|nr:hypothetical protein BU14_0976s0002 [Porphyra umbilicalis]|eukprot:OSX69972.1 hypothetical protein BU14_0976s0002 [Porphyra umbilicalis]